MQVYTNEDIFSMTKNELEKIQDYILDNQKIVDKLKEHFSNLQKMHNIHDPMQCVVISEELEILQKIINGENQ